MRQWISSDRQQQAINDIIQLVNIPSVCDDAHATVGAPFGKNIIKALDTTLAIFKDNGFKTYKDPDGYYGYAEMGEGDEIFAVLCHLDVVPAGDLDDWHSNPFEGVLSENHQFIIGRGVQDDKGPSLAALHAFLSVLEQTGKQPNKKVRFIFGTDEETLWRCMEQYNKKEPKASMGFAPDADFPLIYAEKGLLQAKATIEGEVSYQLTGGSALNIVPDKATYVGEDAKQIAYQLENLGYEYKQIDEQTVQTYGKSVHSKDSADGVNAIIHLAEAILPYHKDPAIQFLAECVKNDGRGFNVLGEVSDDASGDLSFNCATITTDNNKTEIGLDLRIPVTIDYDNLVESLKVKLSEYGLTYEYIDYLAPLYVPTDSKLVQTLMTVYQDCTGDVTTQPIVSGGATFARTMDNCVAFGAMFPSSVTTEHQPNEAWNLQEMKQAMEIYAEAFNRLLFTD